MAPAESVIVGVSVKLLPLGSVKVIVFGDTLLLKVPTSHLPTKLKPVISFAVLAGSTITVTL